MTQKLTVGTSLIIGFILVLSPILGMAAQRAITVDSLEKAYKVRISAIDAQIASTTKATASLEAKLKENPRTPAAEYLPIHALKGDLKKLNQDKETLKISYDLLVEALK